LQQWRQVIVGIIAKIFQKLKDADFQQLTINLFYLIIIAGFQSKKAQFLRCKILVEDGIKKN